MQGTDKAFNTGVGKVWNSIVPQQAIMLMLPRENLFRGIPNNRRQF